MDEEHSGGSFVTFFREKKNTFRHVAGHRICHNVLNKGKTFMSRALIESLWSYPHYFTQLLKPIEKQLTGRRSPAS